MVINIQKIADFVGGELVGDPETLISQPAKIEEAMPGSISFIAEIKYAKYLTTSKASAYIVPSDFDIGPYTDKNFIKVENVRAAVGILLHHFSNQRKNTGIATSAVIHPSVIVGEGVSIGEHVVIEEGCELGSEVEILANSYLGANVRIGSKTKIYSGVQIYHGSEIGKSCILHANVVIGSDGFGFTLDESGAYIKMPQVGIVRIEDQVEIGAACTIDRATMGETLICKGVKLDNLIHIAHNVVIGENTVIAAQAGIAGSTKIGENCMIGGQAGIVGHLNIADNTIFQAKSGMTKSVKKPGTKWYGYPAIEYNNYLKSFAIFKNLHKLMDRVKTLEDKQK